MITFLRKLFIKNYQDIGNQKVRESHGVMAAIGGIIMNLTLFAIKLTIGILTLSMSIISDAINNLTDLFSCFVNLIGFKIASKPADKDHPYGHERIEYIAGMIISFVIIAVAVLLGYTSITKLIAQEQVTQYNIWAFVILGVSIIGKVVLGLFYYGLGKAINSVTLKASMQDSFNDCITTGCVLIASIFQFFYPNLWWLDAGVSIIVALFIMYSGIKMIRETASPLIGLTPDSDFVKTIINDILSNKGVLGVHDVMVHSYGPTKVFMTVHVEIDGYKNLFESHDMVDLIEQHIKNKYGVLLTVHMDPIDTRSTELPMLKDVIENTLKEINSGLSFHDLRVVSGPTHTNVIFDLVIPNDFKMEISSLAKIVRENIQKVNNKYQVVINFDENYIG